MVCVGRALAHGHTEAPLFSDPTAFTLLPDDARRTVERARAGGLRARLARPYFETMEAMMVSRTVAIDQAIRGRKPLQQLVILGAGLDGRAWRMNELSDSIVFEVDHPDTQAEKRRRAQSLSMKARALHFVPVDFTKDSLETELEKATHDRTRQTTWIWEGVVPYLTPSQVEATLDVIVSRSAPGSRLIATYQVTSLSRLFVGSLVSLLGEPFRSGFTPEQMARLLTTRGLTIHSDADLVSLSAMAGLDRSRIGHITRAAHVVVADR